MTDLNSISNIDNELRRLPWKLRILTFESLFKAGSGHIGPCLSMAEILTCLFFRSMKLEKGNLSNDKFILSKGHGVPILYSVFAELGWIDKSELGTLRQVDSRLQGHPDRTSLEFLDSGSGALGQGISIAIGYALAQQMQSQDNNSYCIVGDGEMQEGQIWEAILFAGVKKIKNLCVIVDNNKFQNEKSVEETLGEIHLEKKVKAFGWHYISIDGHSIEEILNAIETFKINDAPTLIDAHTIKGKGVDFMENNNAWHSKVLDEENFNSAKKQCQEKIDDFN
jgi:transketolase